MTEPAHSLWSASKFESIMLCPGKLAMELGRPDSTSAYAAGGTAAHQVLTWALQENTPASSYLGREIDVEGQLFTVDDEMAEHVQHCLDYVRDAAGDDGLILVDQRVNYARYLGVPENEAWGTLDVAIARGVELTVLDFKYGRGVEVEAGAHREGSYKPNPQLGLYALGAIDLMGEMTGDTFERVKLVISQPRVRSAASEYDMPAKALLDWVSVDPVSAVMEAKDALALANDGGDITPLLVPGEKQCKFCKAKATCPALRDEVSTTVGTGSAASPDDFIDLVQAPSVMSESEWLAACLNKVDLIEDWCKAIRAEAEHRLQSGLDVPGYKLVQGKRGNRQWSDKEQVEAMLKTFRLKAEEMYDFSIKSPAQIAKLGPTLDKDGNPKPVKEGAPAPLIGPRQWPKLAALITQSDGKLHVAPASDPRPAISVASVADDFDDAGDGAPC